MNKTIKYWINRDVKNINLYGEVHYCDVADIVIRFDPLSGEIIVWDGKTFDFFGERENPIIERLTSVQRNAIKRYTDVTYVDADEVHFYLHDGVNVDVFLRKLLSFLRVIPNPN